MGLYGDLSYAKTESAYVDPGLDQFFKASTAIQTKHDINSAQFDAIAELNDNLKNTIHNSPAEQEAARKIMEGTDAAIKESVARGDFANLDRELRKTSRDFNTKVKPLQDNFKTIQAATTLRQSLGADALDFTPSENFSTYNPDGTTNRFQADVQKRMDYNGKMRETMALKASTKPINLKNVSDIQYMMKHGSIESITDPQVKAYAQEVFDAYTNNTEYKQQVRELTELSTNPETGQKYTKDEANAKIANDLFTVGKAQVYEKKTNDYMVNTAAASVDEAKAKAEAAAASALPSVYAGILERAFSPEPGSMTTEDLANMVTGNPVTVTKDGVTYKAVMMGGEKIINFAGLNPQAIYDLNTTEGKQATEYFSKANDLEKSLEEAKAITTDYEGKGFLGRIGMSDEEGLQAIAAKSRIPKIEAELKRLKQTTGYTPEKFDKYKKYFEGVDVGAVTRLGRTLGKMTLPSRMVESDPGNTMGVHDGKNPAFHAKIISTITGKDVIEKLNYDGGTNFGGEGNDVKYLVDNQLINLSPGEKVDPDKNYEITTWNRINIDGTQGDNYDNKYYKGSKLSQENTMGMRNHRTTVVENIGRVAKLAEGLATDGYAFSDPSGKKYTFKEVRETAVGKLRTLAATKVSTDPGESANLQTLADKLSGIAALTPYERQDLIKVVTTKIGL